MANPALRRECEAVLRDFSGIAESKLNLDDRRWRTVWLANQVPIRATRLVEFSPNG
jgi:hypothetical protein